MNIINNGQTSTTTWGAEADKLNANFTQNLSYLPNAKILVFGDSIFTQLGSYSPIDYLPSYFGVNASNIYNYAYSGASYKDSASHTDQRQNVSYQISQAISDAINPDIIIIQVATNDGVISLGDYATAMSKTLLTDLDKTKLYEAIRYAYWQIRTSFPNAVCYSCTPIQRADTEPSALTDLYNAIITMSSRYNFIVIPFHSQSGIVKDFEVINGEGRDLKDGLHPYNVVNASGDIKMAKLLCKVISATYC